MREPAPPRKVWVGTYEFALRFVAPDDPILVVRGRISDGVTDLESQTIDIAWHLDDRKTIEVVWHELTHAINWVNDIKDGVRSEETIARKHGIAWSQFHLDNPKFFRWYSHLVRRIGKERKA